MLKPTFAIEKQYWQQGLFNLAGLDEVGMGALAGPVVAAAVVFNNSTQAEKSSEKLSINVSIRDSKTLSTGQREKAACWIKEFALSWAVGSASVDEITALNIRGAAHLAMQRAVDKLKVKPDLLLIDGNPAQPHPNIIAVNIVKGDALSYSIAAASIIAKVHRDNLMTKLDSLFPIYGFAQHKGYGSRDHLAMLNKHGPSLHHRPTYAPVAACI